MTKQLSLNVNQISQFRKLNITTLTLDCMDENLLHINKRFTPNTLKRSASWSSKNPDLLRHVLVKNLSDKRRQRYFSDSDATHVCKPFCKTVEGNGRHDIGSDSQKDYVLISNNFITQHTLLPLSTYQKKFTHWL